MPAAPHSALLEELRERIRRIERRPPRHAVFEATGLAEVDGLLPGGGFPRGALSEIAGEPGSGKTALCLAAMARAMGEAGLAAFVDGRGELYPPAAAALGVDLARLLIVRPPPGALREALWSAEALLSSGAFEVVAVDVSLPPARRPGEAGPEAMVRRLVAAAEKGGTVGLWLAPPWSGAPAAWRVPAAVRLAVACPEGRPVVRREFARGAPRPEREAGRGA